ncbi:MAG: cobyric acid synthase [Desulfotalea sp.]
MYERKEHGGNLRKIKCSSSASEIIDFSANINPLGPPEWLRSVISRSVEELIHYPDVDCHDLKVAIATSLKIPLSHIICGNGTAELLYTFFASIHCKRVLLPVPSYVDYQHAAELAGHKIEEIVLLEENNFSLDLDQLELILEKGDLLIFATPNNPTGILPDMTKLREIMKKRQDVMFCLDEAFIDFIPTAQSLSNFGDNVITLNSMTKFFAIPGLRLGFMTLSEELANIVLKKLPPWSVNTFAQKVGIYLLKDGEYRQKTLKYMSQVQDIFYRELSTVSELKIFPSKANFFLCKLLKKSLPELEQYLISNGIAIRNCSNYTGLDESYFRIAVKNSSENDIFIKKIRAFFNYKNFIVKPSKTPAIMFQGTCSNAGKSIITAAFCRILNQDGFDVAPFKAQNMSLNSFVTADGGEMGRAQVVQAQAARLCPTWKMNPILLKPNSDIGSQVIVHGKVVGNMNVKKYHSYKQEAWQKVKEAYDEISSQHQIMVLEGAGSPGEVNLKKHDIVNMRMAQYAQSSVMIVGDIDRGGVYSSFIGVMEVLDQWERDLVSGFIVNRFRGDASLLASAHDYVLNHTGNKVFGVVPYLPNLNIPEEDSVSFKSGVNFSKEYDKDKVQIGVLSLPHIANFTDIEAFAGEPDVQVKIVKNPDDISNIDALIIPGSKNVLGDLSWLIGEGFKSAIYNFTDKNKSVVGICGGYQMLGLAIADPDSIESDCGKSAGLGLLQIYTEIKSQKQLIQRTGIHQDSGLQVSGYEIHHGLSDANQQHVFTFSDGSKCGCSNSQKTAWGSYLHGMFDEDEFRRWFIDNVRSQKGWPQIGKVLHRYDLEDALNRLADEVRLSVEMDEIYQLLGV